MPAVRPCPEHQDSADTLAVVLYLRGENDEAILEFEQVADVARKLAEDDPWFTLMSAVHYGRCLAALGRYEEAETVLLAVRKNGDPSASEALADVYDAWGKPDKAAEYRALLREAAESGASD